MPDDRPTSTPPEARVWAEKVAGIAKGVEAIALLCATALTYSGKLSSEQWMMVVGYLGAGPVIQRMRGKYPAPTTAILLVLGGTLAAATTHGKILGTAVAYIVRHAVIGASILSIASILSSCGAVRATQRNARPIGALVAVQGLREAAAAASLPCEVRMGDGETQVQGVTATIDSGIVVCVVPAGDIADELLGR